MLGTMANSLPRYSPSGFMRPVTVMLFVAGAAGGVLVAWLYQLLMDWIPFIYLNMLICAGFGGALGLAGAWAVKTGHCRNRLVALLLALPLAAAPLAASYYWGYRSTVSQLAKEHPDVSRDEIMRDRYTLRDWIKDKQEVGWKVKSSTVNGGAVLAVWAVEAAIVFGLVLAIVFGAVSAPYCERCNLWGDEKGIAIRGRSAKDAGPLLDAGDLDALIALDAPPEPDEGQAIVLTATVCAGCADTGFLTVKERQVTVKKGKREEKTKELIGHAVLRADQRARLLARIDTITGAVPSTTPAAPPAAAG
jgi:hypothetical protein